MTAGDGDMTVTVKHERSVAGLISAGLVALVICAACACVGWATGMNQGRAEGLKQGRADGYADGKYAGRLEGYRDGTNAQLDIESNWEDMNFDAKLQSRLDTGGAQVSWSEKDGIWHVHCPVKQ